MRFIYTLFLFTAFTSSAQIVGVGSRMNEIFQRTDLASGPTRLNDPWEITYGPDGFLWITEAKGYKVYRMDPVTGAKTTLLDINPGASGYLTTSEHNIFNRKSWGNSFPWPQGGLMGLAIHPDFMNPVAPKKYIYLGYVHDSVRLNTDGSGQFYTNWLVRFTYNTNTGHLENPVALCDTLPGSKDHNSGRLIIAPVSGAQYLFYAQGDMGAGQFENVNRTENAQVISKYEGKILRFNLEPDGDAGIYDQWIPSSVGDPNPFNGASQSAVWSTGMRNNQGFAYANINGTDFLYGSSHGPFSDDELNIIQRGKNYGHPLVIGYASDGNYDNAKAGSKRFITTHCFRICKCSSYRNKLPGSYLFILSNHTG
jgi:glucose/arabinose dehydrogenase